MSDTTYVETIPPDEDARFLRYAEQLRELQRKRAKGATAHRGLHAKGQAGLLAEIQVLADLPEPFRVGLFREPATYRAYVRFSNGAGVPQHDKTGDVRGVAIKVVGVDGKKIIPGLESARTQDFLLIRTPAIPFRTADEFVALLLAAESPLLLVPKLAARIGLGRTFAILPKLAKGLKEPMGSLATTRYWTALPIAWGKTAAKLSLVPHAEPGAITDRSSPHHLGEELTARLAKGPVVFDLRAQLWVDDARTPIEDATVEWTEDAAPFVTVARVVLPSQDPTSPRGKRIAERVETMSFDPWHALEAHRPLGNMMRARNHAYRLSTAERGAAAEPDGTEPVD